MSYYKTGLNFLQKTVTLAMECSPINLLKSRGQFISGIVSESGLPMKSVKSSHINSDEVTFLGEASATSGAQKVSSGCINPSTRGLSPLPHDCVEFVERTKFENFLELNHTKAPITVSVGGKDLQWSRYVDSQMGSQDAFWAKNEQTGELFYIKYAQDADKEGHIASEIQASALYRLAGIDTPDVIPIVIDGKMKGLASKFVPMHEINLQSQKNLHQGFAADAWLANWDSLLHGNTMVSGNRVFKVDNGGALRYRAQGKQKPNFGDTVEEIVTLVDGRNWDSTQIYSKMTHDELVQSFQKVCNIPDKEIRKIIPDSELAQTLINRKNYMKDVLTEMEETPVQNVDLATYFSKIAKRIENKNIFDTEVIIERLSSSLNSKITKNRGEMNVPSTKTLITDLLSEIKTLEKNGVEISRDDIIRLLQEITEDGLDMNTAPYKKFFAYLCNVENKYNNMFEMLLSFAKKTPKKDNEKISTYFSRLIKMRERRLKQLEDFRIKNIKSQLKYEPDVKTLQLHKLSDTERYYAIKELQRVARGEKAFDIELTPMLPDNPTDKQIYRAWQNAHLGGFSFSDKEVQKSVMAMGSRYNSKHPIKTKTSACEYIADKDYKQDFEIEPVYHWLSVKDADTFVTKKMPKRGGIYTLPSIQCCSTHKHHAEITCGDSFSVYNVKFIMHPKSETSRAYNLGYNQEVIYPAGERFRILDKEFVEYTDPETGLCCVRWEVHMQEA